jgi:hypothetical protein
MTETKSTLREVSKEFSSRYLLEWVFFETNQEEAKRLAPRIGSIAERISQLQTEYFYAEYEKRNKIQEFMIDNWFKTEWITDNWIDKFSGAISDFGLNFIDEILTHLSKMTQVDYISGSELTGEHIPHTVVCPSPMGISFLNIINNKLKD